MDNNIYKKIDELGSHYYSSKPVIVRIMEIGCWEIVSHYRSKKGYILLSQNSTPITAHRLSYKTFVGPIPPGLHVLHRCDNPPCINPARLFLGTHKDNMEDAKQKGRTRNGRGKLTKDKVVQIRQRLINGERTNLLAEEFNVTKQSITSLKLGNTYKKYTHGRKIYSNRRLDENEVGVIKYMLNLGKTQASSAKAFNVHYSTICRIHRGNTWQNLKQDEASNGL